MRSFSPARDQSAETIGEMREPKGGSALVEATALCVHDNSPS